ncbi:putative ribonuclease H-like domain-containing protein [Tanacetum coccineum]
MELFNDFDNGLNLELNEVKTVFNQMEAAVKQCSVDKKYFDIQKKEMFLDNDRLLEHIICQDVMNIVMHADSVPVHSFIHEYNENLMLKAELSNKKGNMVEKKFFDEVILKCLRLKNHSANLELKLQHQKESFLNNRPLNNHNAPEIQEFFHINEWQAKLDAKDVSIAKLKKHIDNLKGKNVVEKDATLNNAKVISPGMFKLDLEPLSPTVLKNRDAHIDYIKHTQENANILWELFKHARALRPLDSDLVSACYNRFQSLLSQLMVQVSPLKMPIRSSLDLYLLPGPKVFESDVKGSTGSSSSAQNVAFVSSESTSSTNDVSTAYGVSTSSGYNSQRENSSSYTDELMYSFFANQSSGPHLDHEDNQKEIKKVEEEMQGTLDIEQKTMGGDLENRRNLKLCNSGSDTEVKSCSKECVESYAKLKKLYDEQREQLGDANDKTDVLTYHKKLLAEAVKEKEELKTKLENFQSSSKGLSKLLNSQMSTRDKSGLGYGDQGKGTGQGENRPMWNNVQRLNFQNKFVPKAVLTKTGIFPVNTARQNLSSQAATTSTARKVNTARPIVNVSEVKAVSAVGGKRETAVKPSTGCNWRPKRHYWNKVSKYNSRSSFSKNVNFKDHRQPKSANDLRTPQQNEVAERKNRTLIEAARTMLADSFLPNTFWAEAVSTACYVLNRVLVTKPQNKTPYELITGKGPNWLFDLDYLTDSMNYQPVTVENKANKTAGPKEANHSAGTQDNIDAGNSEMETEPAQEYFVLPVWSSYTSIVKSLEAKNGDVKPNGDTVSLDLSRLATTLNRLERSIKSGIYKHDFIHEYNENLMLKAELSKTKYMVETKFFDEVGLRCSRLENHNVNLELKLQHQKESFLNIRSFNNQNAPKILEFFKINEWQEKLDAKDVSIANLRKHIENLKGKNVVDNDV